MVGATITTTTRDICMMEEIAVAASISMTDPSLLSPASLSLAVWIRAPHVTVLPQLPYDRTAPMDILQP